MTRRARTAADEQLQARAWTALTRAKKPLTVTELAKTANLTNGGALTYLRAWTTTGRLTRLPATGAPAPYLDRYATPALIARLHPDLDRSPTMATTTTPPAPASTPDPDEPVSLLAQALAYAERGWHVFPLAPGQKRPAVKDWENRATTDPARIERCWSAGPYGIGIACGPSGLVVVDLDQPKPGSGTPPAPFDVPGIRDGSDMFTALCEAAGTPPPWDTHSVTTGRGGTHLYYTHPTTADGWDGPGLRNTAGALGWLIDTRAGGGYVVAPPTVVDGNPYTLDTGGPVAPLPGWLAKALAPRPLPAQGPVSVPLNAVPGGGAGDERRAAYLTGALNRQIASILTAGEGGRNRALYMSANLLGQFVGGGELESAAVTGLLESAGRVAGLDEIEIARTIASGMRAGAKRPRTLITGAAAGPVAA